MDKATLVDADLDAGRRLIRELERRGVSVDVAAWLQDDESGVWRLYLSSSAGGDASTHLSYETLLSLLRDLMLPDLDLENLRIASPQENLVKDLKRKVATDTGLHDIRLDLLGIGNRLFRSSRIYRVVGDAIDNGARVQVKATGQPGTVRGVVDTPRGPRYLVLYDRGHEDVGPLDGRPRPPAGQDFGASDLDFLYVVRTGGWPEQIPQWLADATGVSSFTGTAVASPPGPE